MPDVVDHVCRHATRPVLEHDADILRDIGMLAEESFAHQRKRRRRPLQGADEQDGGVGAVFLSNVLFQP